MAEAGRENEPVTETVLHQDILELGSELTDSIEGLRRTFQPVPEEAFDHDTPSGHHFPSPDEVAQKRVAAAYKGYLAMRDSLVTKVADTPMLRERSEDEFFTRYESWFTANPRVEEYLSRTMAERTDLHYALIATPNVLLPASVVIELLKDVGRLLPDNHPFIENQGYLIHQYTKEELTDAGPPPERPFNFKFVPLLPLAEINEYGEVSSNVATVREQQKQMRKIQEFDPIVTTSMTDAVTYLHTLILSRGKEKPLKDYIATILTRQYFTGLDLMPLKHNRCIPFLYVSENGQLIVGNAPKDSPQIELRLAVGDAPETPAKSPNPVLHPRQAFNFQMDRLAAFRSQTQERIASQRKP
jgi:hypothetical protein